MSARHDTEQLVAIVGMAGRFPGAADLDGFWQLLMARGDAIRPVPADRWDAAEHAVQAVGGFVDGVADFDPTFFGISPREAADIDPQHRLMLEVTWQALEHAGQPASALRGSRTGVYVGASWHDYEIVRKDLGAHASAHSAVGNALDAIAARVSYFLALKGPSLVVETGCSSSLVALHLACQAIRAGDIDGALVGGVNLILAPDVSVGLTRFGGLSSDGKCKAFAASANGFVRGEGAIAIYVKPLARAIADGDQICGVICATAVNNDGGGHSLVTPSPAGQEDLLAQAYAAAGITADDVAYVEAHGTGTAVGDPIEAGVLGHVLGQRRGAAAGPLAIGSVKTNIGHLEAAAGLAGLVKTVLALAHRVVPASLHSDELNPAIAFDALNLRVVREPLALPAGMIHAGVNSFGWGGTNAHVVVRSAPEAAGQAKNVGCAPAFVPVSAHSDAALRQRVADLAGVAAGASIEDLAATLAQHRDQLRCRAAFVADSAEALSAQLVAFAGRPADEHAGAVSGAAGAVGRVAFVFPGQGGQWIGMGKQLFAENAVFAAAIRRCAEALAPHVAWDLVDVIAGITGDAWVHRIEMVQPVLWAMSVALAELWRAAGVIADVVVGHSQGEIAAATVAGILSLEDAAKVVAVRSQIIGRATGREPGRGLMLAVELDAEAAQAALAGFEDSVALAVHNGPTSCVLSGDAEAVQLLQELLEADGVFCRLVKVDYASHSHHMDQLAPDLLAALAGVSPRTATTSLMSTVEVAELAGPEMDAAYWVRNLRQPVRFADTIRRLVDAGVTHVVEISPHPVLAPAIEQLAAVRVLASLRRDAGASSDFALALARAYVAGLSPFGGLVGEMIALPAYPWQRSAYWVAKGARRASRADRALALVPVAGQRDAWHGALELSVTDEPWLADHKVDEAIVLPGAAMLAIALDAARARAGSAGDARSLVDVRFARALIVGEAPVRLTAAWRDDVTGGGSFALLSLAAGAGAWTEHAMARFVPAGAAAAVFPEELMALPAVAGEAFYARCAGRGLNYGPAFRGVSRLFVGDGAALGEIRMATDGRGMRPALWDAALQVCLALCAGDGAVVPTAIARIWLRGEPVAAPGALWSHAVRRDARRFDIAVFDAERQLMMKIDGLTLAELASPAVADAPLPVDADKLHRMQFVAEARPAGRRLDAGWAVCGASGAAALAAALPGARLVEAGADASGWLTALRAASPAGVVFVAPPAADGLAAQRAGLIALAELVRACGQLASPPRLAIVTQAAQAVIAADLPDPGAALYSGFGRVIGREHAELQPRLIDITGDATGDNWAACAGELMAIDADDQVALRGDARFVGRLVRGEIEATDKDLATAWATPAQPFQLRIARAGSFDGVEYRPLVRRAPAAGEVEIEVTASSLNFIDVMKAMGSYPGLGGLGGLGGRAALLGGECAGRVVAVGAGVCTMRPGDRVVACGFGSMASHVTVRADHAQHIPSDLDDAAAAGLPLVLTTAWYALHDLARLAPGETVLIHSAAGGLGLAAIQVARLLGARVIATAGSEHKRNFLRARGIANVFDSRDLAWVDGVRAATAGRGVDVVLNSLTGAAISLGLDALAEDGRFIEVGKQDIYGGRSLELAAFQKRLTVAAVDLAGLIERRPERFARLFAAAWNHVSSAAIRALPVAAHAFAQAGEALRQMARGQHIGKLVLTQPASVGSVAPEAMPAGRFRADATYLITGGLGALGLSLAAWMAERGAGALVLAGRSAATAEAQQQIAAIRARGVRVEVIALDVADAAAVDRALGQIRQTMPALRGVVHAAGLLDDATIANVTADQLARVLAPKLDGARNLDAATAAEPLDLFVMFSSAAALVGNAGQAAYAAGNAFLDALAVSRGRRGLPALSVQWGPFVDVGLAASDANRGARLAERGMTGFATDEAWRALAELINGDAPVVGYVPLDLRRWFDAYPETAAQGSWQLLRQAAASASVPAIAAGAFRAQLEAMATSARRELAEAKVRELASRVLRLDMKDIDRETPFKALGLDSLMGLELRNRLESAFGLKLSPTLLWTYGNPRALAGVLCDRVCTSASL